MKMATQKRTGKQFYGARKKQEREYKTMWYEEFVEKAENPDWEDFDKQWNHIHDWRTYVDYVEDVRKNWDSIPLIGRCAIVACCEEMAGNENWD